MLWEALEWVQGDNSTLINHSKTYGLSTFLKHDEKNVEFRVSMWLPLIFYGIVVIIMVVLFSSSLPKYMTFYLSLKQFVVDETRECS